MANTVYTKFLEQLANGGVDFDSAGTVVRCLLERSTSSYTVDKDHDFVSDLTGLVEISVASYARQTVASKAVTINDTSNRVELTFDNVDFGNLESGQTVRALIFYVQTGGNDSSASNDPLIAYIDTATGLPATLGGGDFLVTIDAAGFIQLS